MAIFFNHIKGCGKDTTGEFTNSIGTSNLMNTNGERNTEVTEIWTWIKWADQLVYSKTGDTNMDTGTADLQYVENNPVIYLNNINQSSSTSASEAERSSLSLGRIITSRSKEQKIYAPFTFDKGLTINNSDGRFFKSANRINDNNNAEATTFEINTDMWFVQGNSVIFTDQDANDYAEPFKFGHIYYDRVDKLLKILSHDEGMSFSAKEYQFTTGPIWCQKNLHVGDDEYAFSTDDNGVIKADNKCEALYFNATSDKRAKENITPTKFSALSIVKTLPTYIFNYKSNPNQKVLGLIAQDAAAHDLDGFNMVDNIEATGEGSDMMQMKESKLVYVLWKAVQELSAEVESLKAEIASLK